MNCVYRVYKRIVKLDLLKHLAAVISTSNFLYPFICVLPVCHLGFKIFRNNLNKHIILFLRRDFHLMGSSVQNVFNQFIHYNTSKNSETEISIFFQKGSLSAILFSYFKFIRLPLPFLSGICLLALIRRIRNKNSLIFSEFKSRLSVNNKEYLRIIPHKNSRFGLSFIGI